ncbi:MAG: OmpA family protein, partial [Spirochaetes bacterium]|nr:OmpA family protein [Spirochaetota bacterium]
GYQAIEYIADLRDIHTPITMQKDFEMERIIALPKELKLNIAFVDEKGRTLKPSATYRLTPDLSDDVILPFKKNIGRVKIPVMSRYKNPEDALAALDKMQLSVAAKKQGYTDVAETRTMAELIRGKNGELKDVIDLTFTMKTGEATPDVEVVKCKTGTGCVAVAYFSTNVSSRLNNEKAAGLKHVVEMWNKEPHKYVYVNGHADSRGTKAHNLKLSRARAAFVKKRLVQYGIPAEMIITKGYGATQLASKDETTVAGRRKNRRAEIFFDATKRPGDEAVEDKAAPQKKPGKKAPKKSGKKAVKKTPQKPLPPEEVEPTKKIPDASPTKTEEPATPDTPSDKGSGVEEKNPFSQPKDNSVKPNTPGTPNTEIKIQ